MRDSELCIGSLAGSGRMQWMRLLETRKLRNIRPQWQAQPHPGLRSAVLVMLKQPFANVGCRHANNCVLTGVVSGRATKQLHANHALFERFEPTGECLFNDVPDESTSAGATSK